MVSGLTLDDLELRMNKRRVTPVARVRATGVAQPREVVSFISQR